MDIKMWFFIISDALHGKGIKTATRCIYRQSCKFKQRQHNIGKFNRDIYSKCKGEKNYIEYAS